jgi:AcrR family transcriptional regulator
MGRPRRGENDQRTVDLLLPAATRLFAERGFAGTSIRDIMAETGLSMATIYHYFANKRELYLACSRRRMEGAVARHLKAVRSTDDPALAIRRIVVALCETSMDPLNAKLVVRDLVDEHHLSFNIIPLDPLREEYMELFHAIRVLEGWDAAYRKAFAVHSLIFGLARLHDFVESAVPETHRPAIRTPEELGEFVLSTLFPNLALRLPTPVAQPGEA